MVCRSELQQSCPPHPQFGDRGLECRLNATYARFFRSLNYDYIHASSETYPPRVALAVIA